MWKCPKCGREFANRNQDHSCGDAPSSVDDYIAAQPENVKDILTRVRQTIRLALPDADECISWRMPTFRKSRNIIQFAAFKNHLGIYPGTEAITHFKDQLGEYKHSKGAVQFPYDRPLPLQLIGAIAEWCEKRAELG